MWEINMLNDSMNSWAITTFMAVSNIFQILFYLLSAWWLYLINKKFWEKHSWLSFVPILQLYSYTTAWQKPLKEYVIYPIIWLIIWSILWIFTFWITMIVAVIYMLVMIIKLYHAISLRCGRWTWTTVWFLFVPFIMFPVVGTKLEDKSSTLQNNNTDELVSVTKSEEVIIQENKETIAKETPVVQATTDTEVKPEQKIEL